MVSGSPGLIYTSRIKKKWSLIVLFSPKEKELDEITLRLHRDGVSSEASAEEREQHLWCLLQRSEGSLTAATEDLQTLRTQQASEMREVRQQMAGRPRP